MRGLKTGGHTRGHVGAYHGETVGGQGRKTFTPIRLLQKTMPIQNPSFSIVFNNAICVYFDGILLKPCFHVAGKGGAWICMGSSRPDARGVSV